MKPEIKSLWLLASSFLILNLGIGSWGLTESSEARYAEISREMYLNRDWTHPTQLGIKHYHKPPITYYITCFGYSLFGINEYGARFFLSVALTLQLFLVWKISMLLFNDRKTALASSVIYFSIPLVLISGRNLTTDAYLNTEFITCVFFFLQYKLKKSLWGLYGFYLVLGLGILTKGPAIFIPLAAFLGSWKLIRREAITLNFHTFFAGILSVCLGISWYVMVSLDDPGFPSYFVEEQIFHRALKAEEMHRAKPLWYYFALAPGLLFPWLPLSVLPWIQKSGSGFRKEPYIRILSLSALSIIALFSLISSKLILYILPSASFVALIAGYYLVRAPAAYRKIPSLGLQISLGLLAVAFAILIVHPSFEINPGLGSLYLIGIIGFTTLIRKIYRPLSTRRILGFTMLLGTSILFGYTLFGKGNPETIKTYKPLVAKIHQLSPDPQRPIIFYNQWAPSIAFYENHLFTTVKSGHKRIHPETQFESGTLYKKYLIDTDLPHEEERLIKKIEEEHPILIFLSKDSIPGPIQSELSAYQNFEVYGKYRLYY